MGSSAVLQTIKTGIRRNFISVFFPTIYFSLIYADWSHTQQWKKQKQLQ